MNPVSMILTRESQVALSRSIDKLRELAFVDYTRLAKIDGAVAAEMRDLKKRHANTDTPKGETEIGLRRDISNACAGSFAHLPDSGIDVVALKRSRDEETIRGIPEDQLVILKILHGNDDGKVARAYRETQKLRAEGKL
jgi:hypothetical protein